METQKLLCYVAMGIAALVCLIFLPTRRSASWGVRASSGHHVHPRCRLRALAGVRDLARAAMTHRRPIVAAQ